MNWNAAWIWHPDTGKGQNFYLYARRELALDAVPEQARLYVTACSLYQLFINGQGVGRGPNPADPSRYYYDVYGVAPFLREGVNIVAAVCYCYGEKSAGIIGQNWGRGGFLLEMRAGGGDAPLLLTDGSWRVLQAPSWDQDAPLNCTLYGDYKEIYDSRREPEGWRDAGFDDGAWLRPEVLGRPPVAPWTTLVEREIPSLGGEPVHPINAFWESASVTYAWRDDWEVYHEQRLVPGSGHRERDGRLARVLKTHDDFTPSILLDYGYDVTGYPEIHVADSQGGVIDLLYGEDLYLVRVDRFVLKGGAQVLRPYNRRTFRYLKLLFPETPAPIEIERVAMAMNTYPVESRGSFTCSDELLNRIWEVGAHTMCLSMLDHFVDCPWRERTIYGGDVYPENLIAHYAFGDPRLNRKTLRQMFALQYPEGALPPYGPYRGCDSFYPAWTAYFGLAFLDHYRLTGDREFLNELWPHFCRLNEWTLGQMETNATGLIGSPEKGCLFDAWMAAPKARFSPWENFPFYVLLRESAGVARDTGRPAEAERFREGARRLGAATREHLLDAEGLAGPLPGERHASQYDNALLLWSGLATASHAAALARRLVGPEMAGISAPFHGFFVHEGLFDAGEDQLAVEFIRRYWGDMIRRGATTFWEHFSLDWARDRQPDRGLSLCHGWSAGPTYALSAHVLGVRPLEPGFRKVLIAPQPADLAWAAGTVPTPHGEVAVRWQRTDQRFEMEVEIPDGCGARVSLPPVGAHPARGALDGATVDVGRALDVPAGRHRVILG